MRSRCRSARRLPGPRFKEPVIHWQATSSGVQVDTDQASYSADRLVLAAGARLPRRMPGLPLVVERQLLFWIEHDRTDTRFDAPAFPIYLYEYSGGWCYGSRGWRAASNQP